MGPVFRYEWVATEPVFPRYSSDGGSTQRVSFTDDNGVRLFVTKFSL